MKKILFLLAILGAAAAAVAALRPDDVKAGAKKATDSVSGAAQQAKAKVSPAADVGCRRRQRRGRRRREGR